MIHSGKRESFALFRTTDLMNSILITIIFLPILVNIRWKGENVSTCEVTAAFFPFVPHSQSSSSDGNIILDANVYGVEVPGYPGRAG